MNCKFVLGAHNVNLLRFYINPFSCYFLHNKVRFPLIMVTWYILISITRKIICFSSVFVCVLHLFFISFVDKQKERILLRKTSVFHLRKMEYNPAHSSLRRRKKTHCLPAIFCPSSKENAFHTIF